ncbi:beta-1,3-N-acetylglucosaminyltransferase [Candidatus Termititenax aidoneus]|uniref:Beta-1,3-N-acetylglucosaminyltransferase n=1 Tax=Termititenax aidoneus TaxID=2218524 RepID=A0A388TB51_TERA1|nr:beta-1,3-N-acetylglucosaminyltransferase [Candidatus Termititenax aidoneus]
MLKKQSPKISVIIPVYNVERYLAQCLENVIYQTCKNLEIIVVDDGATDNSAEVYSYYAKLDKRIKIIKQTNMGLSVARNTGLTQATGTYIHFMDSDDYLSLDYYEKMLTNMCQTDADMACSGLYSDRVQSFLLDNNVILTTLEDKLRLNKMGSGVCKYLYRTAFLRKHELQFEFGRLAEDIFFTIQAVYYANKIITVPGVKYYYRYNPVSIMNNNKKAVKLKEDMKHARQLVQSFAEKHNFAQLFKLAKEYDNKTCDKVEYRLFATIPLLKKKVYANKTKYYLFGLIPFLLVD